MKNLSVHYLLILNITWLSCGCSSSNPEVDVEPGPGSDWTKVELGEQLFFEENLSLNRSQACATCHNPDRGFVDGRPTSEGEIRAGSLGDDGESIGDRNAPSAAYAAFAPEFAETTRDRFNTDGDIATYEGYVGGLFHDGRAATLEDQAAGPPLNPGEMALADEAAAIGRIRESKSYENAFKALYGEDIFEDTAAAYAAMTNAIAEFERTPEFSPFDSKYDRSLLPTDNDARYVFDPASKAAQGKALFFSAEFTNCSACHQLQPQSGPGAREEVFTGWEYHNLGVPENTALRELSGAEIDLGLAAHIEGEENEGKFKTPTLRNIAVTSPYMHNGIFRELETVIAFYEHRRQIAQGNEDGSTNPETSEPWAAPEVDRNLSTPELANGNKDLADSENVEALTCFLMALTDEKYEHLLDEEKVKDCGL